jgi:hypothetical protein
MAGSGRLDMVCRCGDKLYVPATAQLRPPEPAPGGGAAAGAGAPHFVRTLFQFEATLDHRHCIVLAYLRSCPNPGYAGFLRSQSQMAHPMGRKVYKVRVGVPLASCPGAQARAVLPPPHPLP